MSHTPNTEHNAPSNGASRREDRPERFRRSRAAQARRAAQAKADERLTKVVFTLSAIAVAIVVSLGVVYYRGLAYRKRIEAGEAPDPTYNSWAEPWLGSLSKMEVVGLAGIAVIAVIMWWRMTRKKSKD